jgi:riboflavin kinase, archaea type
MSQPRTTAGKRLRSLRKRSPRRTQRKGESLKISGAVVAGLGESASFLAIPWVNSQVLGILGFSPYLGTLNINVRDPEVQRILKVRCSGRILPEAEGFCEGLVCGGTIAGRYPCGVILPLVPDYPANILEIVAPVHLKEGLKIEDGDVVEIELFP